MEIFRKSKHKNQKKKRIGRGGKRGTTSGRGQKGQKSRAGHRIRPSERDFLIRIPKLRGFKNKSIKEKQIILNVKDLEKLSEAVFNKKNTGYVKILGKGKITRAITIEKLSVSKKAREKIEKAGGKVK